MMTRNDGFFIIGAQRAGTTYLYRVLDEHPEVYMAKPVRPEPKFFLYPEEVKKGKAYYFSKHYSGMTKQEDIWGEKGTSYIELEESGRRIKQMFPQSRIIISLRNPIYRAISNYYLSYENDLEKRTLEEVFLEKKREPDIDTSRISVSPFNYLGRGEYLSFIKTYLTIFNEKQVKILIHENTTKNVSVIQELYAFLGVNSRFSPPSFNVKANASIVTHTPHPLVVEELSEYYYNHINQLEIFLGINLDVWKNLKQSDENTV